MAVNHFPHYRYLLFAVLILFFTAGLRFFLVKQLNENDYYLKGINSNVQINLDKLRGEQEEIILRIKRKGYPRFRALNKEYEFPFFVYQDGKTRYWSTNAFVPEYTSIEGKFELKYLNIRNGKFIVSRQEVEAEEGTYEVFSFLPIYYESPIDNAYFQSGFNRDIFASQGIILQTYPVIEDARVSYDGKYFFSVVFEPDYQLSNEPLQYFIAFLIGLTLIFLLVYIVNWVRWFVEKGAFEYGLLFLVFSLFLLRTIMLYMDYPFSYLNINLFNPIYYTSSVFNPSLGDLLLNILALLGIVGYIFRYFVRSSSLTEWLKSSEHYRLLASVIMIAVSHYALFLQYVVIDTIYNNSTWSLDITTELNFSVLKIACYLIYFTGIAIYFLFNHVIFTLVKGLCRGFTSQFFTAYALGAGIFMLSSLASDMPFLLIVLINAAYFLMLGILDLPEYLTKIRYNTFIYLFAGAMAGAIIGGAFITDFEKRRMIEDKHHFANQLLLKNDVLGEFLLDEVSLGIQQDPFIQGLMKQPVLNHDKVIERIRQVHIPSYFDKYEITVDLFDQGGKHAIKGSGDSTHIGDWRVRFGQEEYKTDYSTIFFIENASNNFSKEYISFVEITEYGELLGHAMINMTLKKVIPNSLYPELLVDKDLVQSNYTTNYSYAVYDGEQIIGSSGNFNYRRDFNPPASYNSLLYETGLVIDRDHHLGISGEEDQTIIITSPIDPVRSVISNFSFLFLIFVFLLVLSLVGYYTISRVRLNLSARIQLVLNFAFFLPLLAVSISTFSLINSNYIAGFTDEYLDKAETVSNSLYPMVSNYEAGLISREVLSNQVSQIARIAEADIDLFDSAGKLMTSSQPLIYEKNILAEYIDPVAYSDVIDRGFQQMILDEAVGELQFRSAYVSLNNLESGNVMAIVGIPFFESRDRLETHLIAGFTNIVNIFTFIFIIFLLISFLASRVLTSPLQLITQKLSRTTLSDYNEPIKWETDDEIGLVVSEYNKMLLKLEENKKAIAQNEKETAWREMAKQVAHEIKNPLTPMKLTLQHLRRKVEEEEENQIIKPVDSLIRQVDTLSDIANSFSAFAKMPIPKHERFELIKVLKEASNLFDHEKADIETCFDQEEVDVYGDEKLMSRIISNLIINGIQSVENGTKPRINVSLKTQQEKILLSIQDNGSGIDPMIQDKVFIPNFSTKANGSGIGLAIAKRGVEHAGGAIWFQSEPGEGTTFYIELPRAGE